MCRSSSSCLTLYESTSRNNSIAAKSASAQLLVQWLQR